MKNKNLIESFNHAVEGIIYALKTQRNMKIHFAAAFLVLFGSLFFDFTRIELLVIFFAISFVIVAELINTSIEKTIDLITDEYHPLAKIAKNVAAGGVLISAINALVVGYLLFFDRLNPFANVVLFKIKHSPVHLTFIALALVIIITVVIKTIFQSGTPFQGGVVSGHAAVAFVLASSIAFMAENILISTLAFIISIMVAASRVEGKIHSPVEVITGAVLGILTSIIIFQIIG
ncbi:MAG TPA: diacylglycerol kinase [Tissierellales bacterium]|nr:diacylglycerol kinase [Tissierellales bacterium]